MIVLRVFAGILLSAIMIVSCVFVLGSFATEKAASEESIRSAIDETGIIDSLMNEVLKENTVNMGGSYGRVATEVMKTDPMKDFIAEYMAAAISTQVFGKHHEEIANDELMAAFAQGLELAAKENGFTITPTAEEEMRQEMMQVMPALTAKLNDTLARYETTAINEDIQQQFDVANLVVSKKFRYGCIASALLSAILLVLLFWRSRMGFMWAAVCVFIASGAFGIIAALAESFGDETSYLGPAERMLCAMCENGTAYVAIAGGIATGILVIICAIMRAVRRSV